MNPTLPLAALLLLAGSLRSQHVLPGDDAPAPAVGESRSGAIAAGGPGFLAVWEDPRTRLAGGGGQDLRVGNQTDVYAQLLSATGQPMLSEPIVVTNLGRNQRTPTVAWNGTSWLVVFVTERPDWYFFEDIVGVRIDATGQVLDPTPIPIRPEQASPSNWYGTNPSVGSDGTNWIVVWEDWNPANSRPTVAGCRIAANGTVLDPNWVTLYEYSFPSFGPREPQITFAGGSLLLAWRDLVSSTAMARRLSTSLQPLGAPFQVAAQTTTRPPSLASDGNQHYLVVADRVFRIAANGTVLDTTGIVAAQVPSGVEQTVHCAWNGSSLSVVQSRGSALAVEVFLQRVGANGALLDPTPIQVTTHPDLETQAFVAGAAGATEVLFAAYRSSPYRGEDFRALQVDANGVAAAHVDVDASRPRQQNARFVATPGGHVVTFVDATSAGTRFLAQRVDASGEALDAEPIEVATWTPGFTYTTAAACNGDELMFAWTIGTECRVRRYDLALQPLDPQPIVAITGATGTPAIAAGAGDFLVAAVVPVTNHLNSIRAVRVQGGTSALLDATPLTIGGNYAHDVAVTAFGVGWLVHWTRSPTHDSPMSQVYAAEVALGGQVGPAFLVSTSYYTHASAVAVQGLQALVVYQAGNHGEDGIRAQRLQVGGTFVGPEIVVCDDATGQVFPAVTTRGDDYVVAWTDYRAISGVEAMRGDLWLGRVRTDGTVPDGNGIPLATDISPEEDVALGSNGACLAAWSTLVVDGVTSGVPRIVVTRIDELLPTPWHVLEGGVAGAHGTPALAGFGEWTPFSEMRVEGTGALPSSIAVLCAGPTPLFAPLFGGVLAPLPEILLALPTDAAGRFGLQTIVTFVSPGTLLLYQGVVLDPTAPQGFAMTNGLYSVAP